jgi:hypothetical protein
MGSDLSNNHINHLVNYCQDLVYSFGARLFYAFRG